MSFFESIRVLFPSFLILLVALALIVGGTLEFLRRKLGWGNWCTGTTAVVVLAFWLHHVTGALVGLDENRRIYEFNQARSQAAQQAAAQSQQPPPKQMTVNELKGEFLKTVDALLQNPGAITTETRKQLFLRYAPLFPSPETKALYAANIERAYLCQRFFYEDALATRLANKVVIGQGWNECMKLEGSFFNRQKLIADEVARDNRKTLEGLVSVGKKGAFGDPAKAKSTEDQLRKMIQDQQARINVLKVLFSDS